MTTILCPDCGQVKEEDGATFDCRCDQDAAWETYRERVRLCAACELTDCRDCDPDLCSCAHAREPALEPMETPC